MAQHRTRWPGVYYRDTASGRSYRITWRDHQRKQHWKVVPGGEQAAVKALADIKSKLGKGENVAPNRLTVKQLCEDWLDQKANVSDQTAKQYRGMLETHIYPELGSKRVTSLTVDDVARVIAAMQRAKKSPWTVRSALKPLRGALAHAVRRGMIPASPVDALERHERPKVKKKELQILDGDGIHRLLLGTPERFRALIATAVFSGLRLGELLRLRWEDIDFGQELIHVGRSKTDAGSYRNVILLPALADILLEHRRKSGRVEGLVFTSLRGNALSPRSVRRFALGKALENAKLPHMRFHDLRHTFASILIGRGHDASFVARQLGHASPSITLGTYTHLFDGAAKMREARAGLEAEFGPMLRSLGDNTGLTTPVIPSHTEAVKDLPGTA